MLLETDSQESGLYPLLHAHSKLLIVKSVTSGLRIELERGFESQIRDLLRRWYASLASKIRADGLVSWAIGEFERVSRANHFKSSVNRDYSRSLFDAFQKYLFSEKNSSECRSAKRLHREYSRKAYELGAVTAARSMGYRMRAPLLADISKAVVSKGPGDFVFELTDASVIQAMESGTALFGAGITASVISDARDLLKREVLLGNKDVQDVAEKLSAMSGVPEWRGLKIARTEIQRGFNKATFDMYSRSGVQKKAWVTVGDNRVRA